nr:hypothetical protein [Tanacetum cinerariifolium]
MNHRAGNWSMIMNSPYLLVVVVSGEWFAGEVWVDRDGGGSDRKRPIFACYGGLVDSGLQERYGLIEMEEGVAGKGVQVLGGKW